MFIINGYDRKANACSPWTSCLINIRKKQNWWKEIRNSFKKWPFNLWSISNKTIMGLRNITKAATFKSFLHINYKKTQLLIFVKVLFNIFMRQTLTNYFWGLHKNMNCAFPLKKTLSHLAELAHLRVFIWKISSHLGGIPAKSSESHLGRLDHFLYEQIILL